MNAAASVVEVRVPDMGNFKDVAVIDVLVQPGDSIAIDTPLVTLESDKATMDVPSTAVGVVEKVHTSKGGKVNTGDLIATVRADGAQRAPGPAEAAPPAAAPTRAAAAPTGAPAAPAAAPAPESAPAPARAAPPPVAPPPARAPPAAPAAARGAVLTPRSLLGVPTSYRSDLAPIDEPGFTRAHASPSVRRFARELGVNLAQVAGHGFKDRITHDDVKAFVKGTLATPAATPAAATAAAGASARAPAPASTPAPQPGVPAVDYSQFGPTTVEPLSRIQRISGPRLQASWTTIPHVTQFDEADITELEQLRASLKERAQAAGVKLTPLAFIMRACVKALQEFPRFNSALATDGANLIVRKYVHIGFAADTPNGLVVPVVRDADRKDVYELARHLGQLSEKARAGKLPPTDMQGGCFTISSLGGIGGTAFTPIINAPEVAILGVSRAAMRPIYRDLTFVPRLMLPLSLSYDHRVIDGAMAARFTTWLAQALADPRGLLEAVP
jgi:pyruvate dehydrogenase E2 component (dihydrolipoamide acetyltransferase)